MNTEYQLAEHVTEVRSSWMSDPARLAPFRIRRLWYGEECEVLPGVYVVRLNVYDNGYKVGRSFLDTQSTKKITKLDKAIQKALALYKEAQQCST